MLSVRKKKLFHHSYRVFVVENGTVFLAVLSEIDNTEIIMYFFWKIICYGIGCVRQQIRFENHIFLLKH